MAATANLLNSKLATTDTGASANSLVQRNSSAAIAGQTFTTATLTSPTITGGTITSPTITGATSTGTVTAVAAAGTNQATAGALSASAMNLVSAADGTKGVVLPAAAAGKSVRVYSSVATNGLPVYPASGGTINSGSADAAVTIEGQTLAIFEAVNSTNWAAIYTANT